MMNILYLVSAYAMTGYAGSCFERIKTAIKNFKKKEF